MKSTGISIRQEDPSSPDAVRLMDALSAALEAITGSSGRASFDASELNDSRAVFAVARNEAGEAVGCGAIRPMDDDTAEVKRMYAGDSARGIGSAVLAFLEQRAGELGYRALRLETRKVNERAVGFYLARGYKVIENYGKYRGREEAVCFEKEI